MCPSFPDLPVSWLFLLPHQGSSLHPCTTDWLPFYTHRQHLILQYALIALTTLYFAIFMSSRNQGWSEDITGGMWLI